MAIPLLAALLLAGCSLVPEYERPAIAVPQAWRDGTAGRQAAAWPAPDWWRGFGSADLDALIAQARASNLDIRAAAARILQARAQEAISGASLWPSVSAGGDYSRTRSRPSSSSTTTTRSTRPRYTSSYSASIDASYEVDFWGANAADLSAAEAAAAFSEFDAATVGLTATADTASTYFQVLLARERLEVARRNLALAEQVLSVVDARVRNGAVSPLDLAQQRSTVATQRATIPSLETTAQQAENNLATLLGTAPGQVPVQVVSLTALTLPEIRAGLPSELLTRRPDIRAAEARLIGANANVGVARAAFLPSFSLTAGYGRTSTAFSAIVDPASAIYRFAASLAAPVFEGGALEGGLDLAKAQKEELVHAYQQIVLTALADVENALVTVRQAAEQEGLQAEVVRQSQRAFDLAQTRYAAGATDLLVVLDAQRTLYTAQDALVQVRFTRLNGTVALYRALGGGWQ